MAAGARPLPVSRAAVPTSKAMLGPLGPLIRPMAPPTLPEMSSSRIAPVSPVSAPDAAPSQGPKAVTPKAVA